MYLKKLFAIQTQIIFKLIISALPSTLQIPSKFQTDIIFIMP